MSWRTKKKKVSGKISKTKAKLFWYNTDFISLPWSQKKRTQWMDILNSLYIFNKKITSSAFSHHKKLKICTPKAPNRLSEFSLFIVSSQLHQKQLFYHSFFFLYEKSSFWLRNLWSLVISHMRFSFLFFFVCWKNTKTDLCDLFNNKFKPGGICLSRQKK